jgi:hypothetical protein
MTLVTSPTHSRGPAPNDLPDLLDPQQGEEDGERISVTDVNGTVARFEMAYTPEAGDRFAFGPPLKTKVPSFLYLAVALVAATLVGIAYTSSSGSALFRYIVEGDKHRILSAPGFALILVASAVGTVVRTHMRGVIVSARGIETRTLLMFGLPRVRAWAWPQVDRIIVDDGHQVLLELWDGSYERLPEVGAASRLAELLQQIAHGRRIQVTRLARIVR